METKFLLRKDRSTHSMSIISMSFNLRVYSEHSTGKVFLPFVISHYTTLTFSYPEPFLRAVRRGAVAKSISELACDWLVLTQDFVFLPCFLGIRLWIWPEPLVAPRVRRALGTRMTTLTAILVPRALLTRGQRSATRGSGQIHIKLASDWLQRRLLF